MVRRRLIAAVAALTMLCGLAGSPAIWGAGPETGEELAVEVQPEVPQTELSDDAAESGPEEAGEAEEATEDPLKDEAAPVESAVPEAEPISVQNAAASLSEDAGELAETPDTYVISDYRTEEAITTGTTNLEVNRENPRIYDVNAKISWSANIGKTFVLFDSKDPAVRIPSGGYSYINVWLYNPVVEPYQINWVLRTGNSPTDTGNYYFRYKLGVNQAGWQLITVPLRSFGANNPAASLSYGICQLTIAANEWKGDPPVWPVDHFMCIERMWLSKEPPNTSFTLQSSSYEYGAGYVPGDLGGDSTYTFTFTGDADPASLDGQITVLEDESEMPAEAYAATAEGRELRISFAERLRKGRSYTIRLGDRLYDLNGNQLSGGHETFFTVEGPTTLFKITKSSIPNGAVNQPVDLGGDRTFTLTMNNPPDPSGIARNIRVSKDGVMQYSGFEIRAEEQQVRIIWDQDLEPGAAYTVELGDQLLDVYGNALQGEREFTFSTEAAWPDIFELAAFDSEASLSILNLGSGGCSITRENTRMYETSLRIDIPKAPADRTVRADGIPVDGRQYSYVNYWIYSPDTNGHTLNLCLYTSDETNSYFFSRITVNWSGWRLVSIPLASYAANHNSKLENINGFSINANGWVGDNTVWPDGGMLQIDRIWLSKNEAASLSCTGTTRPQGLANAPVQDFEVGFVYNGTLSSVRPDAVVLKKGGAVSGVELETRIDGNRLMVRAKADLEPNTSYTLTVSEVYDGHGQQSTELVSYPFTTAAGPSAGIPRFRDAEGGPLTGLPAAGQVEAVVPVRDGNGATLYLAAYNELGNMTQLVKTAGTGEQAELTAVLSDVSGAYQIKAFVCGPDGALLRDEYGLLGPEAKRAYPAFGPSESGGKAAFNAAGLTEDRLVISGTAKKAAGAVLVSVRKSGAADPILLVPVYPDQNGQVSYHYAFGEDQAAGVYKVGLDGDGAEVEYLDAALRQDILNRMNGAASIGDLDRILEEHEMAFGIAGLTAARRRGLAQTLQEQKPYADIQALNSMITVCQALLSELNQTAWGGLSAFLLKNADIVMKDEDAYQTYVGLPERAKNLINQAVIKKLPVDGFLEFRDALAQAVQEYQDGKMNEDSGQNTKPGRGGSGGGGGNAAIGVSPSAVQPQEVAPWTEEEEKPSGPFVDLGGVSWAEESILALYEKGIISPAEDQRFRPDDPVTREEFVKLLTGALGLAAEGSGCSFTDAEPGAWYLPYLAAAEQAGIALGNPDGSFGVGARITREDLAVMAYRAVGAQGRSLNKTKEKEDFADHASISEYALEAVYEMQGAGILSGMGDGSFEPGSSASRAQAAKVIAALMEQIV